MNRIHRRSSVKRTIALLVSAVAAAVAFLLFSLTLASLHVSGPVAQVGLGIFATLAAVGVYRTIMSKPLSSRWEGNGTHQ